MRKGIAASILASLLVRSAPARADVRSAEGTINLAIWLPMTLAGVTALFDGFEIGNGAGAPPWFTVPGMATGTAAGVAGTYLLANLPEGDNNASFRSWSWLELGLGIAGLGLGVAGTILYEPDVADAPQTAAGPSVCTHACAHRDPFVMAARSRRVCVE